MQEYESAQKYIYRNLKNPDSSFFTALVEYSKLVDYEAYETENGGKTLNICEKAIVENSVIKDTTLLFYRTAVLNGMLSTIHIKRGAYLQGLSKANDSQKNWKKLLNTKYSNEANFALALTEYYKITLFNKSPKNYEKLKNVLEKLRKSLSADDEMSQKMYLSYIWVLQEQKLWSEAKKIFDEFFEKYSTNTMMIRAYQAISVDKKDIEEIVSSSQKLLNLSEKRIPKNYSDILSARRAMIFAADLENKKDYACEIASSVMREIQYIPQDTKKTYWVKKHLETIKKYADKCKKL
jgi:tetratricopeptide (TPR) repeat protein